MSGDRPPLPQLPNRRAWSALREGAALLERSARGKLLLTGSEAVDFLNGQVTNELADIAPGEGRYAAFLSNKGKLQGDLRILALPAGEERAGAGGGIELLLDCERAALQPLFDMIGRYKLGYDVQVHKRTLQCALLGLIGPRSREIAAASAQPAVRRTATADASAAACSRERLQALREHDHLSALIDGAPARLVAGAESDLDVFCGAADAERVAAALLSAGAEEIGEADAETLRVARGMPRFPIDMDQQTIPQEAGINERAVSFTKGCYVGQETVARLHYKGRPNRTLRGLKLRQPVATGDAVIDGERQVGQISSSALCPERGAIAMAMLRREAENGSIVRVGPERVEGEIVALPFG